MANLRDIRIRIKGVRNTSKITSAMKMVSAAKLKRAQDAAEQARPYVVKMDNILSNLVSTIGEDYSNPLIKNSDEVKSIAIIVITSDKGLCGSFNNGMYKYTRKLIKDKFSKEYPNAKISILAVGKKSVQHYKHESYDIIAKYPEIFTKLKFKSAVDIVDKVKNGFISGKYDMVFAHYNEFVNVISQVPSSHQLLPIKATSSEVSSSEAKMTTDYVFEPDQKLIMDELLPKLLNITIWRFLLESNAAEQASRMMAMDSATNNANDLLDELNIVYNRERQAAITTEMLEIVGGANALEGK